MVHISRLKLRNFKSFRAIDIPVPKSFLCLAGPNGSGKSNLCDAIRFVLGETSLKSLRAKRVRDLIFSDMLSGEVTLFFEGDKNYEVKRVIRKDGKILYKLNGKKTTRMAILEALKSYNIDESGRNIIAQGGVQRIINMSGRERRTIIDSVAGIADFEEKKKEALKELDIVDTRIKDANLVLGERSAFLKELEKEREIALQYKESKVKLTNAKATLLKTEMENLEKDFEEVLEHNKKIAFNLANKEAEFKELEEKIAGIETKRLETSKELQLKQQTSSLIRKIEELKAAVSSKTQLIEDKEQYFKKLEEDNTLVVKETKQEKHAITELEKEIESIKKELKNCENELKQYSSQSEAPESQIDKVRSSLKETENKLYSYREHLIAIESDIKSKNDIVKIKNDELENIKISKDEKEADKTLKDIELSKKKVSEISNEIEEYFKRTKAINVEIAESDKHLLELKEKAAILRVRVSPGQTNTAIKFVNEIKSKGEDGIYGTVAELIKFDDKYSSAVEASTGSRLLYIVVEDAEIAGKIIERLKKAGAGRATFIPLKEIKSVATSSSNEFQPLINVIKYNENVKKAVEFVFGDTILVNGMSDAKKHIGKARMVTLQGELFERSGVITGGKIESNFLAATELKKLDAELEHLKKQKESNMQELFSIREHESGLRSKKAEAELKIKVFEMELKQDEEKKDQEDALIKRKEQILQDIEELGRHVQSKHKEQEKLTEEIKHVEKKIEEYTILLSKTESEAREISETEQMKKTDITSKIASLRATFDGKRNELELRNKELSLKDEKIKNFEKEKKDLFSKIEDLKRTLSSDNSELLKFEEKIVHHSKEIEKLFEGMKKYEQEMQELGKLRGEKRLVIDRLNKDINQVTIKRATVETRLQDIKAEFSNYNEFEVLNLKKDQLLEIIKNCEQYINSLGNVNMAAIEMYDKKQVEIQDMREKIDKLAEERSAVIEMVNEIEHRKKEVFFETFHAVSENFKKMFSYIDIGEGFVYLDNPAEPFESGLYIKIKRNNKEHTLDSLSGGENSLVALMFIFAIQFFRPAPFYILDEVDAALDKENSKRLSKLVGEMSKDTQFILVSHNDTVMSSAETVLGVTKVSGVSKLVGINLEQIANS